MIDKTAAVWTYPDGRQLIRKTASGRDLLDFRFEIAWTQSRGLCCLCGEFMTRSGATLEHLKAKGMGGATHDDRQSNLGISHLAGNVAKGSQSLERYLRLPLEKRRANCRS